MLRITAGPRPATVSLAPGRPITGRTCLTSHRATLLAGTKPHPNPIRSGYCNHQSRATRAPPSSPLRSNPHRPGSPPRFRALALLGRLQPRAQPPASCRASEKPAQERSSLRQISERQPAFTAVAFSAPCPAMGCPNDIDSFPCRAGKLGCREISGCYGPFIDLGDQVVREKGARTP